MSRLYKSIIPVLFSLSLCFYVIIAEKNPVNFRNYDYPSRGDLRYYLKPLERVINFSNNNRDNVNLNWNFGLFLASVNLHLSIQNGNISPKLRNHLETLLSTNSKTIDYAKNNISAPRFDSIANLLFTNFTTWSRRLKKLEFSEQPISPKQKYPEWNTYYREVDYIDKWIPSAVLSDSCFEDLSKNHGGYLTSCQVPDDCRRMLISGTNFGYALTHRLMFLELAYFGRHCTVFSADQDEYMKNKFCRTIYNEAEYIAHHGYKHADLMLEQITLCSLNGRADFLRRSWLNHLLGYQTPLGCFGTNSHTKARQLGRNTKTGGQEYNTKYTRRADKNDMMNATCGTHITAVGASTLAAAVRFILENN